MIDSSEILWKLSIKTGAAGNSSAQSDPDESLGKYISTSAWAGGSLHDLFDVVTGVENAASDVEYRCLFIHNSNATNTYYSVVVWISAETSGGAAIAIGVDTTDASAIGASSAQALEVATEGTAPSGVSFSSPVTQGTGISLGDIPPGYCKAFWVRRTAANSAAKDDDGGTLQVAGDTSE